MRDLKLKQPLSHLCVRLHLADNFLYSFVESMSSLRYIYIFFCCIDTGNDIQMLTLVWLYGVDIFAISFC